MIEVAAAGVNFADVGMGAGMMGRPRAVELPYTPGSEAPGVVAALGEGTEGVAEGDARVTARSCARSLEPDDEVSAGLARGA